MTMNMPDWDKIFEEQGMVFTAPHPDMKKIAQFLQNRNVRRVLDIGCGTGRHLVFLSKLGFEMYGFDASPKALEIAKNWLKEEGLVAELFLHQMEKQFPYGDAFFDAILSIQVIHHNFLKDIQYSINECERVLTRNGLIFISVPILNVGPIEHEKDWALEKVEDSTYIPRAGPESGIPHHYFTETELRSVFSSFEILDLYVDSTGHRFLIGEKK
jgi:ubiquinone/menaquinone biosynthesis C-methylase UbiE